MRERTHDIVLDFVNEENRAEIVRIQGLPEARDFALEAGSLRIEIGHLLEATSLKRELSDRTLFTLNRAMAFGPTSSKLVVVDGMPRVESTRSVHPFATLAAIALASAHLVADVDPGRLRRCTNQTCRLWFVDTSKGGRRRWCSMARCGNRAKSARFRARHETES